MNLSIKNIILSGILLIFSGCAYYNIFFNAEQRYSDGLKKIEESKTGQITPEIRNDFYAAIDKSWKLLNIYSDSSGWSDDALLLIGKSHFQVEEYVKAERFLTQFVSRYRESEFIPEASLWLGRSLIELDRDDEALVYLNKVINYDEDDEFNALAHLTIGRIYIKKEVYDQARTNFNQAIEFSGTDELKASAQFLIAESYYSEKNYLEAAQNFELMNKYDASTNTLFDGYIRYVDCLNEMEEYDESILLLEEMSTQVLFLDLRSVIRAKIGDCYKLQGKFLEATDEYSNIFEIYPRSEGSAIAAYGMAQLMEFAYSDLDSAKNLYQRVGREYKESPLKNDAENRVRVLDAYQKITANIEKDVAEYQKADSLALLTDVKEVAADSTKLDSTQEKQRLKKPDNKKAKTRTREQVLISLDKNRFALAEFFLLTLDSYDSAATHYSNFINSSTDSILVPKAHYALYYIYNYQLFSPDKADSLKRVILTDFSDTPYAAYFNASGGSDITNDAKKSPYHYLFLQGEAFLYDDNYMQAIDIFNQIATEDSGSSVAQKARYAAAWTYENKLLQLDSAVYAYELVAKEYPDTEYGKIAMNKIREPVLNDSTKVLQSDSTMIDSTTLLQSEVTMIDSTSGDGPESEGDEISPDPVIRETPANNDEEQQNNDR
jgi:TolA-binding protein